jgi:hypothetical protein
MTATSQNNLNEPPPLSIHALIFRGALLMILGYCSLQSLFSYHHVFLPELSTWTVFVIGNNLPACLVYLFLGIVAGYLFWPQGVKSVALWIASFFTLMYVPNLVRNGLDAINGILDLHIHVLLLPPLVMVGYELSRVFVQDFRSRLKVRQIVFWLVVVANVSFIGPRAIKLILFYTSEAYATAIAYQIPTPESARNVNRVLNKRGGFNGLIFTGSSEAARDTFEFYDAAFLEKGFIQFEEPSFEMDSIIITDERWGKRSSFSPVLEASWTDREKNVIIRLFARSTGDPDAEVTERDVAEPLEVWVSIRPFLPYDEELRQTNQEE